jgi:hypothetical protein
VEPEVIAARCAGGRCKGVVKVLALVVDDAPTVGLLPGCEPVIGQILEDMNLGSVHGLLMGT